MSFVHKDKDFEQLLAIVARDTKISEALIEKDYWVKHTLWALHETGLDIWFKGGTSLSKGFGIIQRFSEDLDMMNATRSRQTASCGTTRTRLVSSAPSMLFRRSR